MSPTRIITCLTLGAILLALSVNAQTTRPWPKLPPDFDETVITGSVTDEETGERVAKFTLVPGHGLARKPFLRHPQSKPFVDGDFEFVFDRRFEKEHLGYHAILIRIEAEGYAPQNIELPSDEQQVKLDIKLRKGQNITGTVLSPGEQPADGAVVLIGTRSAHISLDDDEPSESAPGPQATADANGEFVLPPSDDEFRLVAIHESGYGDVLSKDFEGDKTIRLQPWGRIEGVVMAGAEPVPGAFVVLRSASSPPDGQPVVARQFFRTADAQGRFIFDRVAPGEVMIARRVDIYFNGGDMAYGALTSVDQIEVAPGDTLQYQVGGRGRPVNGHVPLPPGAADEWFCYAAHLMPISPETKRPTGVPRYAAEVDAHGHFSFIDVEPGEYRLHVQFEERQDRDEGPRIRMPKVAAIASADVTVDEIPGGRSDEPTELGEIELKPPPR